MSKALLFDILLNSQQSDRYLSMTLIYGWGSCNFSPANDEMN
ncbi:uncharacterized protein METZ01_LOCUS411221 [marine metagenome]|uniref:Uncharacterized protein n=1 Tax=marine metagenome TaxID=408172 RepID=A0A382WHR9_9ZZZZ